MKKPHSLDMGDKVAIVSLSSGALGEDFAAHELELGKTRLEELGLHPVIMPNACKGIKFLAEHPEARVLDLKNAFADKEIKGIICAIGGTDGYKTIPYIFEDKELISLVQNNPKVFLGYSDSTIHHLALGKLGLATFYGQAFLTDLAELDTDMLPYSKYWLLNMFLSQPEIELAPSEVWYSERTDFSPKALGTPREVHLEELGFSSICKKGKAEGELFGGCIEVIHDCICTDDKQKQQIFAKYSLLPANNDQKMLFLETSDQKIEPKQFQKIIVDLKNHHFFDNCAGVLFGKPQDQKYMHEYISVIKKELADKKVLFNLNFGHAFPHCIMPYGTKVAVDFDKETIKFVEPWFND